MTDELKKAIENLKHPPQSFICIDTWKQNQKDALNLALKEIERLEYNTKNALGEIQQLKDCCEVTLDRLVRANDKLASREEAMRKVIADCEEYSNGYDRRFIDIAEELKQELEAKK